MLIHCSDGWDRTVQMSSLALIMLDPFHRTIQGFALLIEKEWLSVGHKFHNRVGHADANHSDDERSPVFLQFVESVFQFMNQYPCACEWNEQFLITLMESLYSCQYGTFLFNNEKQRSAHQLPETTTSLWAHVLANIDTYRNVFYRAEPGAIIISSDPENFVFWKAYHFRHHRKLRRFLTRDLRAEMLKTEATVAETRVRQLEAQVQELEAQLTKRKSEEGT